MPVGKPGSCGAGAACGGPAAAPSLAREKHFDSVIEPRDLAEAYDAGLRPLQRERGGWWRRSACSTATSCCRVTRPAPSSASIRIAGDPGPARLPQQLRLWRAASDAADHLTAPPGLQVVIGRMADRRASPILRRGVALLRHFPFCRYFRPSMPLGAVGYNSFHERIQAGLPIDLRAQREPVAGRPAERAPVRRASGDRLLRAHGRALSVLGALDRLMDPEERARIRLRRGRFRRDSGAAEAAKLVAEACTDSAWHASASRSSARRPGCLATTRSDKIAEKSSIGAKWHVEPMSPIAGCDEFPQRKGRHGSVRRAAGCPSAGPSGRK